jgi:hypothetical protein
MAMAQNQNNNVYDFVDNYMELHDIDAPEDYNKYVLVLNNIKRLNISFNQYRMDMDTLNHIIDDIQNKFIELKNNGDITYKFDKKNKHKCTYKLRNDKTYTENNRKKTDKYVLEQLFDNNGIQIINKIMNTYFYYCYVLNGEEIKSGIFDIYNTMVYLGNDCNINYKPLSIETLNNIQNKCLTNMVEAFLN